MGKCNYSILYYINYDDNYNIIMNYYNDNNYMAYLENG